MRQRRTIESPGSAESEFYTPLAAADLRPEVGDELRKKFPDLRIFADFREMFATCPTDVVCVSTYPPTHEEIAAEALKRPLEAILVEKPIAPIRLHPVARPSTLAIAEMNRALETRALSLPDTVCRLRGKEWSNED